MFVLINFLYAFRSDLRDHIFLLSLFVRLLFEGQQETERLKQLALNCCCIISLDGVAHEKEKLGLSVGKNRLCLTEGRCIDCIVQPQPTWFSWTILSTLERHLCRITQHPTTLHQLCPSRPLHGTM